MPLSGVEPQLDALLAAGVNKENIYQDEISGKSDKRPGLDACLKALRAGDVLMVWKLDRLGRSLKHLVNTIHDLADRKIGFKVLTGQGAEIDTTTASGKLVFGIFAALAEFERELISERTKAGLAAARARGREGGRSFKLTKSQVRLAQASMKSRDCSVSELCEELGISRQALYKYVGPDGELREHGKRVLKS
ncbi:recombinase family protein [Photorhabdus laumondii]|uniref:Transposon DNA-invertase n=1 Tax=Photorhabdus laumondii subsp. clarkei TaxID=2029685 RepID=A0A329VED0_9GAMM|nr:recombinase family protein [Photorhabdus laumondii]RAW85916.1 transposon DNA-invertase [Photorhabdus laumondii subsp. clarkei]